ncbi:aspartyl protease family protein [Infirmifilum lucidum]|uniref:Aspartyl protease family protein n=1 Tax=Infirmifilum lucidum TaxID=2776706 RepID=A0A7L9FH66_9CREN|nr:aspartyl protease family protein [Infirmifilum lucidum]QOJ79168.1 aspartyl protease family protein [Infirmifilum lucidum]
MGYVRVKVLVGSPDRTRVEEVVFLADTGAYYTVLPSELAESLSIKPMARAELLLADKRVVEAQLSYAYIKVGEREGVLPVAIMDVPEPVLGVTAMEGLGIKVDPVTGRVEYTRPYGLAMFITENTLFGSRNLHCS